MQAKILKARQKVANATCSYVDGFCCFPLSWGVTGRKSWAGLIGLTFPTSSIVIHKLWKLFVIVCDISMETSKLKSLCVLKGTLEIMCIKIAEVVGKIIVYQQMAKLSPRSVQLRTYAIFIIMLYYYYHIFDLACTF